MLFTGDRRSRTVAWWLGVICVTQCSGQQAVP